ncbi:DoxX family protein [Thalassomonas actiniarum]|uniref:DoxX family protein n=1 Tax=Thalassomonas actiniarum TaxID=485447 RepID=A0AAE9YN70_9GAMM|nr:DoxX family protein [Thalassomonas actiniarum]WDD97233.1 DoxX family protein [Thalassomonas actiniarum]
MNKLIDFSAPAGRFLIALIFLMSGVNKVFSYAGTQGYMEAMGVPGFLLPLVIITEVFGALAIILGWQTRIAALALAGFSLVSAALFHADFSDQIQMIMFMKNVAIAGGFLILIATGLGSYALDNRGKE